MSLWNLLPDEVQKTIIRFTMLEKDVSPIVLYNINESIRTQFLSMFDEYPVLYLLYAEKILFKFKTVGHRLSNILIERFSYLKSYMLSVFVTKAQHLITCPFDVILSVIPTIKKADKSSFSLFRSFLEISLPIRSSCSEDAVMSFLEKIDAKSLVDNHVQCFCGDIRTVKFLENIRQRPLEQLINTSNIKTCIKVCRFFYLLPLFLSFVFIFLFFAFCFEKIKRQKDRHTHIHIGNDLWPMYGITR